MRYNPRAEPTVDVRIPGRPAYVSRRTLSEIDLHEPWKRRWALGGAVTALEDPNGVICRSKEEWGTVADLETAWTWWRRHGAKGLKAGSPAGIVFQAARDWFRPLAASKHRFAQHGVRGGWEEAQVRGVITGPHKVLDLRRAYRWALTQAPLPERHSMRIAKRWAPELPGLHWLDVDPWPGAPWPLRDGGRVLVESPLDVTLYGPPVIRGWYGGVTWTGFVPADALAKVLDEVGAPAVQRAYWGLWFATTPVTCTFRSGKVTHLRPYGADFVRAHLITARVRRRLAEVQTSYRYVDAVIVPDAQAPATGTELGDWREVRSYPDGVWIGHPGAYGPAHGAPDRYSGNPVHRKAL